MQDRAAMIVFTCILLSYTLWIKNGYVIAKLSSSFSCCRHWWRCQNFRLTLMAAAKETNLSSCSPVPTWISTCSIHYYGRPRSTRYVQIPRPRSTLARERACGTQDTAGSTLDQSNAFAWLFALINMWHDYMFLWPPGHNFSSRYLNF